MKMNTNSTYRSIFLECLRENAANMRREHQDLAERISIALAKSRANLLSVERINQDLQKMKVTVSDALHSVRGSEETEEEKGACQNLLTSLIEVVADSELRASLDPTSTSEICKASESECSETVTNVSEDPEVVSVQAHIEKTLVDDNTQGLIPSWVPEKDTKNIVE